MRYRVSNLDAGWELPAETHAQGLGGLLGSAGIGARDLEPIGGSKTDAGDDLLKAHAKATKSPAATATDVEEAHMQPARRLDLNRGTLKAGRFKRPRHR